MMNYQLIDFGKGRKLERIGTRTIDRPSPAAADIRPRDPSSWLADSVFDAVSKGWAHRTEWTTPIVVDCGGFVMPATPTPFGHIGLFPEQQANWQWLAETSPVQSPDRPVQEGLNLFAYTGASTMAMVAAGMRVTHVDAAKPNVTAAGENASLNGWSSPPIRFMIDDALKFASREARRERRYHTIVLDPPAYGHAPSGRAWRLERDLWPLLQECLKLIDPDDFRLLITGHSAEVDQRQVQDFLSIEFAKIRKQKQPQIVIGRLGLSDSSGRKLDAGFFVRVTPKQESWRS